MHMEGYERKRTKESNEDDASWRGFMSELEMLSRIGSPSRYEGGVRNYLHRRLEELGISSKEDAKGNLLVEFDGPEGAVLLSAHMDKIGKGSKIRMEGERVIGRLDDTFGLSLIMEILREGMRPSVLFTVEEESIREVAGVDGKSMYHERPLKDGIYNAGARFAIKEIHDGVIKKPGLMIFIDTSAHNKIGKGALVSKSSLDFPFPAESMKSIAKILHNAHVSVRYWDAGATDAIEASFLSEQPIALVQVATEHYHTDHEIVDKKDIVDAIEVVKTLIRNRHAVVMQPGTPEHARKENPIILDK